MAKLAPLCTLAVFACSSPAPTPMNATAPPISDTDPGTNEEDMTKPNPAADDPYLWLEEVDSEKSLAWAKERNEQSVGEIEAVPGFAAMRDRIRTILDSKDKLAYVSKRGAFYYNFWQDEKNVRGLLRRTSLAQYKKDKPAWETVLDIDELAKTENENWIYKGNSCLYPKYDRCLVSLSRGGGDAVVVREFDPIKKAFVAGGFELPEAKSRISWKDQDTVYVGTDFGPGSLTKSGYPRITKEWTRGTPLTEAKQIFEGEDGDVSVGAGRAWDHGISYDVVVRTMTFYSSETHLRDAAGALTRIEIPEDANASIWNKQLLVTLRTDWTIGDTTWPGGAMIATPLADFLAGKREFTMLFEPAPNRSLDATTELGSVLIVNELEDIKNKLYVWKVAKGKWKRTALTAVASGGAGTTSVWPLEYGATSDDYWMHHSDYLTPAKLSLGKLTGRPAKIKQAPEFFDAKGLVATQHFATSKDGTRVPYFQVARKDLALDGSAPTLLYGYGGFEVSLTPGYSAVSGAAWLERGGVYVVANIRGGGEYGPAWHQAALKHNRQRAYDDFIAIAEDLVARKITNPAHLGIMGGSNGGLLTAVMLTQRPDLFGAIVSSVPLADMKRYHKLLAGASWMAEYGDPDVADDWEAIAAYSPYQNLSATAKYPATLFTSSTRDDRVHPAHARKMVARMLEQGHQVLYWENIEGGHGGAANSEQYAQMTALEFTFLAKTLGLPY